MALIKMPGIAIFWAFFMELIMFKKVTSYPNGKLVYEYGDRIMVYNGDELDLTIYKFNRERKVNGLNNYTTSLHSNINQYRMD